MSQSRPGSFTTFAQSPPNPPLLIGFAFFNVLALRHIPRAYRKVDSGHEGSTLMVYLLTLAELL